MCSWSRKPTIVHLSIDNSYESDPSIGTRPGNWGIYEDQTHISELVREKRFINL